jgi:hypothetical protein
MVFEGIPAAGLCLESSRWLFDHNYPQKLPAQYKAEMSTLGEGLLLSPTHPYPPLKMLL